MSAGYRLSRCSDLEPAVSCLISSKSVIGPEHSCRDRVVLREVWHTLEPCRKRLCFDDLKMPLPLQSREVDIGDTAYFDVIEREAALQVYYTLLGFEIGPAEVARCGVKPDAELRPAFRCGKLDVHIPPIDTLFQGIHTLFRA